MAKRKSMADIDRQYDRISRRIHDYAINDEISVESENKARANLIRIYDKYQDRNARALGYKSRVDMNTNAARNTSYTSDYNKKLSYSVRAGVVG